MIKYIRVAGTCCDLINDGNRASIKTWGPIANRSGVNRVVEVAGCSIGLDVIMKDMELMITIWRDSYGKYEELE